MSGKLRVQSMAISNFRTFRARTVVPFQGEAVPVLHGVNASGKSNAIAALEWFFRGLLLWLERTSQNPANGPGLSIDWENTYRWGFVASARDMPADLRGEAISVEAEFEGRELQLTCTPVGAEAELRCRWKLPTRDWEDIPPGERSTLATELLQSKRPPMFRLDARRAEHRIASEAGSGIAVADQQPLGQRLAAQLFALDKSFDPLQRRQWKSIVDVFRRFPQFAGSAIDVVEVSGAGHGRPPEYRLRIEREEGRIVQSNLEISSGEHQVLSVVASVLASGANIVAIEEPELSLDLANQRLLRSILAEQVESGLLDQVILESHSTEFDGNDVIRFARQPDGSTVVSRVPAEARSRLQELAANSGADLQWVSADGYTRLPEKMRKALGVESGGELFFLPDDGKWRAFTAAELDMRLGGSPDEGS